MKIAVVGTGISGLVVARGLAQEHDITVFEAGSYVGGHTNTIDVQENGRTVAVDTGFIVFNEVTYPGFCELLKQLRVPYKPSNMGFSVACEQSGLEYSGSGLGGLFAQRRNWLRPGMWRLVRDIVRFYREAPAVLERPDPDLTLGQFLEEGRYSRIFIDKHLVPMCAAVWSARADVIHAFPMRFLVQFFHNHGFLRLKDRPVWQVVRGGSRSYVEALIAPFADRIRLSTPVRSVRRVGAWCRSRRREGRSNDSTGWCSPVMEIRHCGCWPTRIPWSRRSWVRLPSNATSPRCTGTKHRCPGAAAHGPRGTITCAGPRGSCRRSPTG
ncbi:MAG: FAD-dependent oxidoreductase [Planctomycetota bacterium]